MHALYLKNEKAAIAEATMVRAMDTVGDYWKDRYRGADQNLHILQGTWGMELIDHYEAVAARDHEGVDEIQRIGFELSRADGFFDDKTHFDAFVDTIVAMRLSLPEFPITRYKGGGFSCSFRP